MCPAGGEQQTLGVYALGRPSVDKYMKFSLCKEKLGKDKWKRRREIEEEGEGD